MKIYLTSTPIAISQHHILSWKYAANSWRLWLYRLVHNCNSWGVYVYLYVQKRLISFYWIVYLGKKIRSTATAAFNSMHWKNELFELYSMWMDHKNRNSALNSNLNFARIIQEKWKFCLFNNCLRWFFSSLVFCLFLLKVKMPQYTLSQMDVLTLWYRFEMLIQFCKWWAFRQIINDMNL